jgi:hypothetical protein
MKTGGEEHSFACDWRANGTGTYDRDRGDIGVFCVILFWKEIFP